MVEPSLPDHIANQLRRDILRGKLPPGSTIKERDNAADMGVSRTPMREAIRILAKEGLVLLRPSRSPIVANPSLKEISDAIDVLRALEVLSGELACDNATEREIADIRAIHERMTDLYGHVDKLELFEIDMGFHLAIAKASHNEALAETHNAFLARLWRARYLSASQPASRERVLRQHGGIVEGLERRDPKLVRKEIQAHLEHLALKIRHQFEDRDEGGNGVVEQGRSAGRRKEDRAPR
ncbi:GntR family transcriptional regulator [Ostreiculturibacter nitratireducens]|uniref:GntR family transcriptional regulator n=1 Tax=Ostreiculturibacter nitratireducens TaxID=3075226 RepID=UPI0031B5DDC4